MEGKKKLVGSSPPSSSTTSSFNDLFGSRESQTPSSGTGVFASIFEPPSTGLRRYSSNSESMGSWQKQPSGNQEWNTKKENLAKSGNGVSTSKKDGSSTYQDGRAEPCHLSSSLYYGGQDIYSQSSSPQSYKSYPTFKKDGEGEDSNGNNSQGASRGNWWEGSLYY